MTLKETYETRYREVLVACAGNLQRLLEGYLEGVPRVDRVAVRAKSTARFLEKARKQKSGEAVYADPMGQIQDQIGARIIVFYTSDVESAGERVLKYCRHIEQSVKEPVSDTEFGYFGKHFILALPPDCVPANISLERAPTVFELQVRTLFQHAWSEAEHDLAYKPPRPLTPNEKRRFAFTAAQAWGADRIFQELFDSLISGSPACAESVIPGRTD